MDSVNESNEGFTAPGPADATDLASGTPHISLTEAPVTAPDGSIGVRVNVETIMDQIHQHWARQMADQVQRNAELAAALTVTSDELAEVRAKLAALTEVTNAPAEETASAVREIPASAGQDIPEAGKFDSFPY